MRYVLWTLAVLAAVVVVVVVIGWRLPVKHTAMRSTTVPASADSVFALITGFADYPAWRTGVKTVEVLPGTPVRFREESSDGTILFEVVEMSPPQRLVTRIADPSLPFGGRWTFELAPARGGTNLQITEDGEVYNPFFRFVSRFIMGHSYTIDRYLGDVSRRLATP